MLIMVRLIAVLLFLILVLFINWWIWSCKLEISLQVVLSVVITLVIAIVSAIIGEHLCRWLEDF